jgi:hypothetical protein
MLGVEVSETYEAAVKKTLAVLTEQRRKKKEEKANTYLADIEQDNTFAYIAGYTSGGAPFGIRFEELNEEERSLYTINQ